MADHKSDTAPVRPRRINHIVLNVRDIEESHRFWTEIVGMKQVATLRPRQGVTLPKMRFYSADHDGKDTHHDIALVESPNVPSPEEWKLSGGRVAAPCASDLTFGTRPPRSLSAAARPYRNRIRPCHHADRRRTAARGRRAHSRAGAGAARM